MREIRTAIAVALLLLFSGCSAAPSAPATPSPEVRTITVRIVDTVPLAVYWNYDDKQCTAQHMLRAKVDRGPQVTIADGSGNLLASQDGPLVGGSATLEDRCTVDVIFKDVPAADVYVVTVKGHDDQTWDRTEQASGADQVIEVEA